MKSDVNHERTPCHRANRTVKLSRKLLPALIAGCFACSPVWANPTGAQVIAGQASISNNGNVLTVINTPGSIINWQSFSVNPGELTQFLQQSASSTVLNRIVGQNPTQLFGALQSNGKVYLINPNGILFGAHSQVNVGGLVASSLDISNADFQNGKLNFSGTQAGTVVNQGNITTPSGGQVYLIAPQVQNNGIITSPQGEVLLAAGHSVQLIDGGDPNIEVVISAPTDQALNLGSVVAQGGKIGIYGALVNQGGIVNADSATLGQNGQIVFKSSQATSFEGDSVTSAQGTGIGGSIFVLGPQVTLAGNAQINASGQTGGGTVLVGGDFHGANPAIMNANTVALGANTSINADAIQNGNGGKIAVWSTGTTSVAGSISAQGGAQFGNGGYVETSGAQATFADSAKVSTAASMGLTGTWLIDPVDFTIAATGGDITGVALSTLLGSNSVLIDTSATGTNTTSHLYGASGTTGNIFVNDNVSWSNNTLTLSAQNNITINSAMTATATAGLMLMYGQQSAGGGTSNYYVNAPVNLTAATTFQTQKGSSGSPKSYTVIDSLGAQGSVTGLDLQGINGNLTGNFVLGSNIDATPTGVLPWNSGAGFVPLGTSSSPFTGTFDGLGHAISSLSINFAGTNAGLFGYIGSTAVVQNVAITSGTIAGVTNVGGLVGYNSGGLVNNSFSNANVSASGDFVGGLVGNNTGTINGGMNLTSTAGTATPSPSYATGSVSGANYAGGLVGLSGGTISNTYATGTVSATGSYVGGLVGYNTGTISNSDATAAISVSGTGGPCGVTATGACIGGLVGNNSGSISNSYATGNVSGASYVGGLVGQNSGGITGSHANVAVAATANYAGGLVGQNDSGTITGSYAIGIVSGADYVGGLAGGNNSGSISTSYATGAVTGSQDEVGGLVGAVYGGSISNTYATGHVTGLNFLGGLVGLNSGGGDISNSYSAGAVTTTNASTNVGAFTGLNLEGGITNSFYDSTVSAGPGIGPGVTDVAGTIYGMSTANMQVQGNFTSTPNAANGSVAPNWTFTSIWSMPTNGGRPVLTGVTPTPAPAPAPAPSPTTIQLTVTGETATSRTYDGTTIDILTGGVLTGVAAGDTVTLTQTGTFGSKNVGSGIVVTSNDTLTITGDASGDIYTLVQPIGLAANITPAILTVNGQSAANKVYNGNTAAALSGGTLSGVIGSDVVTLAAASSGTFASKNVGTNVLVTAPDSISGAGSGNYLLTLPTLTASITPATLTVTGQSAGNKVYDGTTAATLTGGTLSGVIGNDAVTLNGSGNFAGKNVGTAITVTVQGSLSGADSGNYTLAQPGALAANITPLPITVTATGSNKVYNGNASDIVTLNGVGILLGDNVNFVSSAASFANANVGTGKTVTVSGISATGADAGNYQINNSATAVANIAPAVLTVVGEIAQNKIYDGTTGATLIGGTLSGGIIAGDLGNVTLNQTGSFASPSVGNGIAINAGDSLSGSAAGNYALLQQPMGLTANIIGTTVVTQATPTILASNSTIIAINTQSSTMLNGGTSSTSGAGGSSGNGNSGTTGSGTNTSGATNNGNVKKLYCN